MFDFASARRTEGDRDGVNDKGLVTGDRKTRKDAFYFYKANWNPEPMVYITSREHGGPGGAHGGVRLPRRGLAGRGSPLAPQPAG